MDTPPPTTSASARQASSSTVAARPVRPQRASRATTQTSVSRSKRELSLTAPTPDSICVHQDAVKRVTARPVYAQYSHEKETTPSAMWASKSTRKRKRTGPNEEAITAPNSDDDLPEVVEGGPIGKESAKWTCPPPRTNAPRNARPAKPANPDYIIIESSPEPEELPYCPPPPPAPLLPAALGLSDEPAPYKYISGVSAMRTTGSLRGRLIELVRSPEYVQRLRDSDAKEAGSMKSSGPPPRIDIIDIPA